MKIAELFAVLGFKIDGAEKLDSVKKEMTAVAGESVKGALAVNAINVAFFAMIDTSIKAGQALRNFALSTGLSTEELQLWQHAALVDGLAAEDLTAAIKGLQNIRASFDLGNPQNVGAWQLLGVSPTQDPFKVITALRARLSSGKLNPGVARNLLGQVGLESILPLLRANNAEFEQWSRNFLITEKQTAALARLNAAWQDLRTSLISVKTQFSATFAPALAAVAKGFAWLAEKIAIVVRWLQDGGPIATALRWGLIALAAGLVILGAALLAVAAAAGLATGAIAILEVVASPVIPIIAAISAIILVAAASIAALILLVDDMWHAFTGGKSVLADLGDKIFGPFFTWLFEKWDLAIAKGKAAIAFLKNPFAGGLDNNAIVPSLAGGGSSNVRQENNIQVDVNGAQDPRATGREVFSSIKAQIAAASYQAPVPSY